MGRRQRTDHPGAYLLVTNRGTAQTAIYRSNTDRRAFLSMLGETDRDFGVTIVAYVLMGNHYHLVVRLDEPRLPEAMQFLDGRYARRFNAVHERTGALFHGRYDARLLDSEASVQAAGYYVHLNPLRAGLVSDPTDFRWSSLVPYLRGKSPLRWLALDLLRGRSGEDYHAAVETAAANEIGSLRSTPDEHLLFADWDDEQKVSAAFAASDRTVAACFGVSVDELYVVAKGRANVPRMVGLVAAMDRTGQSATVVAARYGLRSRRAVHAARERLRRLSTTEPAIRAALERLDLAP